MHMNKFAYSKGGAEEYMLQLATKQVAAGDDVAIFGARADELRIDGIAGFSYDVVDFHAAQGKRKLTAAREVLWSSRSQRALESAASRFRPDVIHLHNYAHQLSSSVIATARAMKVPVVNTAHDYKLVCPAYVAVVQGADCFACARHLSPKLLIKRCHHSDLAWSALVAAEAGIVRSRRLTPDVVLAPSEFMAEALRSSWLADTNVRVIRNPATATGLTWVGGGPMLYVGRLSREKGVARIIEACVAAGVPLSIAGDGPLRSELEALAGDADVRFHGHVSFDALAELRRTCRAQVIPSEWPENAPLSALEAAVDGVPIVATSRGGVPELASIGARMSLVSEVTKDSIVAGLKSLDESFGDLDRFRANVAWDTHLDLVGAAYEGVIR
ncbi:glycosyltransferase [Microbacterium sp. P5_E9]